MGKNQSYMSSGLCNVSLKMSFGNVPKIHKYIKLIFMKGLGSRGAFY
jgi:hypothetical protein